MSAPGDVDAVIRQLQGTLGKLEIALGAVSEAIVWTSEDCTVQWCNAAFERLVGRQRISVLGTCLAEVLPLRRESASVQLKDHPAMLAAAGAEPGEEPFEYGGPGGAESLEIRWSRAVIDGRRDLVFTIRDVTLARRKDESLRQSEQRYRLLVEAVRDYAIFMLDPEGRVATWNAGAQRVKGFSAAEIVGSHFSRFYTEEDLRDGKPERMLAAAAERGSYEDEGFRVRKDGSRFWASVVITALRGPKGELVGFTKVVRDLTRRKQAEDAMKDARAAAENAGRELEAFSYSVAHDLRAPLRAIDGYSRALIDHHARRLDEAGMGYLRNVRTGVARMSRLIDDLLTLSRVTRSELRRERIDLSAMAGEIAAALRTGDPARSVEFVIAPGVGAEGDAVLLRAVLENLLGNSWKYTGRHPAARIEFGVQRRDGRDVYFVRDDGAGFDMKYVHKLFTPFSRLHGPREFEGTGVGLATVSRAVTRHRGRVWGEGRIEKGATFYFTLWEDR